MVKNYFMMALEETEISPHHLQAKSEVKVIYQSFLGSADCKPHKPHSLTHMPTEKLCA